MSESTKKHELIPFLPPLLGAPNQWMSDMAYARQQRIQNIHDMEEERKEITKLRLENYRLKEELDKLHMHPLFDDSSNRINVNHDLWILQQQKLKDLDRYRNRYYVAIAMAMSAVLFAVLR